MKKKIFFTQYQYCGNNPYIILMLKEIRYTRRRPLYVTPINLNVDENVVGS